MQNEGDSTNANRREQGAKKDVVRRNYQNRPVQQDRQSQQASPRQNQNTNPNSNQSPNRRSYHQNTDRREQRPSVSVVIPLLNEEESLPELALQLENELHKVAGGRWEVIFIDDGSTDSSYDVIRRINQRNQRFKAIRFRRNFGKSAALSAGFSMASGYVVITMDADLQDDPAEIPNLIAKIKEGYDLVTGWKKVRKDPISKTIPSKFFNFVTSLTSGIKLHDFNCGLKAYKNEVVKSLQVYGEMHRYLPALAHWEGFKVAEIPVKHHERRYGKSKFGLSRFLKGFLDLLTVLFTTRYFKRPLHFFGTIGSLFALTGLVLDSYLTVEWFMQRTSLSNRPLALFGVALIIVGVQLISIGLVGELIAKSSYEKIKYSIKEMIR